MRKILRVVLLLFALLPIGCGKHAPEVEDVAIYHALLKYLVASDAKLLVVRENSLRYIDFQEAIGSFREAAKGKANLTGEIASLKERNSTAVPASRLVTAPPVKTKFITDEELQAVFSREGRGSREFLDRAWKQFYQENPGSGGYLSLSRPGIGQHQDTALVYFEFYCGSVCGRGAVALMRKSLSGWKVENVVTEWVS